jgi:hypothetical protein
MPGTKSIQNNCACEDIQTAPHAGKLFLAHEMQPNTDFAIDMKVGEMVTFRQFAVYGKFPYDIKFDANDATVIPVEFAEMKCLSLVGHEGNEDYGQLILKASELIAPETSCSWTLKVENEQGSLNIIFNVVAGDVTIATCGAAAQQCPTTQIQTETCGCEDMPRFGYWIDMHMPPKAEYPAHLAEGNLFAIYYSPHAQYDVTSTKYKLAGAEW